MAEPPPEEFRHMWIHEDVGGPLMNLKQVDSTFDLVKDFATNTETDKDHDSLKSYS